MSTPSKSFRDFKTVINLNKHLNKELYVKFTGGREVKGVLKGHDAMSNMVLENTVEFLKEGDNPSRLTGETRNLGLLVARGTSVTVVYPCEGSEKIDNPFVDYAK